MNYFIKPYIHSSIKWIRPKKADRHFDVQRKPELLRLWQTWNGAQHRVLPSYFSSCFIFSPFLSQSNLKALLVHKKVAGKEAEASQKKDKGCHLPFPNMARNKLPVKKYSAGSQHNQNMQRCAVPSTLSLVC